jgi:hypothetical protein
MSRKLVFSILLALGVFAASSVAVISSTTPTFAADTGNDNS